MIPIDHGLSFPDEIGACFDELVWYDWPQVKSPLLPEFIELISKLDPLEDVQNLSRRLKMRDSCLTNFRAAEILLKKGVAAGLNLYEIASILYREDPDEKSKFEEIMEKSRTIYTTIKPIIKNLPKNLYKTKELVILSKENSQVKAKPSQDMVDEEEKASTTEVLEDLNLKKMRSYSQDYPFQDFEVSSLLTPLLSNQYDNFHYGKNELSPKLEGGSQTNGFDSQGPTLKKSISLVELNKSNSIKRSKKKEIKAALTDTSFHCDSLFFYYVESFLDQIVTIFSKDKKKKEARGRFYSAHNNEDGFNY